MPKAGNYSGAPDMGLTPDGTSLVPIVLASQRRKELETSTFITVRNLAHLVYRKDPITLGQHGMEFHGEPIMTFQETLEFRSQVLENVLAFEASRGLVIDDRGDPAAQNTNPQAQQNGAQQMNQPTNPQNFAPPQQQQMQPQQGYMPPPQQQQQMQPQGNFQPPAGAMPQQGSFQPPVGGMPQMQPQASAAQAAAAGDVAPAGKKTRRAAGSAVAPPPPAPPPSQPSAGPNGYMPPNMPVSQMQPQTQQAGFQPGYQAPPAQPQQNFAPQLQQPPQAVQSFAPVPQQMAPVAGPGVDLSIVTDRLDSIGKGLVGVAKDIEDLKATNAAQTVMIRQLLAVAHHMYATNASLAPALANVKTLGDFQSFLGQYTGN